MGHPNRESTDIKKNGILIETDILIEYLVNEGKGISVLRNLLTEFVCYTTFVQAAELLSAALNEAENKELEKALFGLKVLGSSSRYSFRIANQLKKLNDINLVKDKFRFAIISAIAIESDLTIITSNKNFYAIYSSVGNSVQLPTH